MPKSKDLGRNPAVGLWIVVLCLMCASTCPSLGQEGRDASQPSRVRHCGKARALAQKYRAEQMRADWRGEYERMMAEGLREAFTDTDLLHCNVGIEIRPDEYDNVVGFNEMTIRSETNGLTHFTFRLREQYDISSIGINGGAMVSFTTPSETTRVVNLDRAYERNDVFTLTVAYSGHAESFGFGSIEFTQHAESKIVYTFSEPYYAYTWWPIKDGDWGQVYPGLGGHRPGHDGDRLQRRSRGDRHAGRQSGPLPLVQRLPHLTVPGLLLLDELQHMVPALCAHG